MRGKEAHNAGDGAVHRITPACAGKRCRTFRAVRSSWDHPRMCGEKAALPPGVLAPPGSPPRMRGKELAVGVIRQHGGITPAHAGKSRCILQQLRVVKDHPRTCGEKQMYFATTASCQGSPPHMRGKVIPCVFCLNHHGITPAHAGKSQGLNIFHTKRSSGPSPAAVPAGPAGSCPASRPSQFPPRMTVISPRP